MLNNKAQLFRYYLLGITLNIFGFLIYIYLTVHFGFKALTVVFFLYPLIFLIYFLFQNFYVFQVKKIKLNTFLKFSLIFFINYLLNLFLIYLAVELYNFNHIYSQIFIILSLSLLNFIVNKKLVFID